MSISIGLIESKGLVALIEAADVILKNSPVKILGVHKLQNGLLTLAVSGNSDYVNAAIESGVEAGRRVGEIYAFSVVDNPDKTLLEIFSDLFPTDINKSINIDEKSGMDKTTIDTEIMNKSKQSLTSIIKTKAESKREKSKPLQVTKITPIHKIKKFRDPSSIKDLDIAEDLVNDKEDENKIEFDQSIEEKELTNNISTIERLRLEALGTDSNNKKLTDNSLPKKKKITKVKTIDQGAEKVEIDFEAIKEMNVHKLRHYARGFPSFPIKGREISRANRNELIELFKIIKNN
jgi:microcompartment protein CcmL/EutN